MLLSKKLYFYATFFLVLKLNRAFEIPEVTLEAYKPSGFRASIPHETNIQLFGFHANHNVDIMSMDDGEYYQDIKQPTKGKWIYYNSKLTLKPGDYISYWVYVQHDYLGFRRAAARWNVTRLVENHGDECQNSISNIKGSSSEICSNIPILADSFENPTIDSSKWVIQQYIPTINGPDYEFVSYENDKDTVSIANQKLVLKPKAFESMRISLDLSKGCTRKDPDYCISELTTYTPPVVSGRLVSKLAFRYGIIEIRAKLPTGDWIFPEIYLEQENNPSQRLWIAYARGNDKLLDSKGADYGGRLLFAGPVTKLEEPDRSTNLVSKRSNDPFSKDFHVYAVHWTKNEMKFLIDGVEFGKVPKDKIKFSDSEFFNLVLGVGVGGINDFPDGFNSVGYSKPWTNKYRNQMRTFFDARASWYPTWQTDPALQVDYVKITSI